MVIRMRELINELQNVELAIFDLDGVIYRGEMLISNADKVIQELKDLSIKVVYNSNNSTATRDMYVERLKKFGIITKKEDFYTSASITASEMKKIKKNANIFVIGENGLREELKNVGHKIIDNPSNFFEIDFVIVGLDRNFKYKNLAIAQKCILEGNAQFYATNADSTLPSSRGLLPGAGVMVNAVKVCTGKDPIKIFGKPEPYGLELILKKTKILPNNACIFGDRLNTDILAGNRAGIITCNVLTGVTSKEMIDNLKKNIEKIDKNLIPILVINNLSEIFKN
jgi:4-nitrophenyl phosphatase